MFGAIVQVIAPTLEIVLAIEESATNCGILPPGVLEVAILHSTLPLSSSWMRSTLV